MRRVLGLLFGALGYWVLFGSAMVLFACAVLVPEWRAHEDLRGQREQLVVHVAKVKADLDRLERAEAALPEGRAINERLARLQLGYRARGEVGVWVPEPILRPAAHARPSPLSIPGGEVSKALSPLVAAARKPKGRSLLLLVAGALLVAAVGVGLLTASKKKPKPPLAA